MAILANLPFQVFSHRPSASEEGFAPFLEAAFPTEAEANTFAADWNKAYATTDSEVEFYVQVK